MYGPPGSHSSMQSQSMNRKALFSSEFVLHFEGQLFHPFLSESVCLGGESPCSPIGAVTVAIHTGCNHALIQPGMGSADCAHHGRKSRRTKLIQGRTHRESQSP